MDKTHNKGQSQGSDLESSEENVVMGDKEHAKAKLNWESTEAAVLCLDSWLSLNAKSSSDKRFLH